MRAQKRQIIITRALCRITFCPALVFLVLVQAPVAQLERWKTFGVTNNVIRIDTVGSEVWALTSGGILVIDPVDLSTQILTNTDGLLTNDFTDIITDSNGDLWIAGLGRLIKRQSGSSDFVQFAFLDQTSDLMPLHALADDGVQLWVGADIGLALFAKTISGGQIQDSYQRFGSLPAQTPVINILLTTDSIWVATELGIAVGERTDLTLLKSFANWSSFTDTELPQLSGLSITSLISFQDSIFIGTTDGAFSLRYTPADTSLDPLPLALNTEIFELRNEAGSMTLYTSRGKYSYDGATLSAQSFSGAPNARLTSGITVDGRTYLGIDGEGVYSTTGIALNQIASSSLPGANVLDITLGPAGLGAPPVAAFGADKFAQLSAGLWSAFDTNFVFDGVSVSRDSVGALWLGTFGGGLWRIAGSSITNYDTLNSTLKGNSDGGLNNFVVIPDMVSGPRYNYIANFRAIDINPVSIVDQFDPSRWTSFGAAEGVANEFVVSLDIFRQSLIVASEKTGAYLVYLGADPFNKSDYIVSHYHTGAANQFLRLSADVLSVARFDNEGNPWLGHPKGLMRFDPGIEQFVDLELPPDLGPGVNDIAFDPQGNAWLATRSGLGKLNLFTSEFTVFNTLNSGLVSDNLQALFFDRSENQLWITTDNGISRFSPDLGQVNFEVKTVSAYPNPFLIIVGDEVLRFNYSGLASARIFSEAGELIWTGNSAQGWSGVNQSGRPVASGVYLFSLTDNSGESGLGKILLIRN